MSGGKLRLNFIVSIKCLFWLCFYFDNLTTQEHGPIRDQPRSIDPNEQNRKAQQQQQSDCCGDADLCISCCECLSSCCENIWQWLWVFNYVLAYIFSVEMFWIFGWNVFRTKIKIFFFLLSLDYVSISGNHVLIVIAVPHVLRCAAMAVAVIRVSISSNGNEFITFILFYIFKILLNCMDFTWHDSSLNSH